MKNDYNNRQTERNREIAHYILSCATTMTGVCVTVIALFRVMKASLQTYADEILGYATLVFIISALFAYAAMRKEHNKRLERWADLLFFTGMLMMLIVGFLVIYSTY
jgi:hypothetical protein